MVLGIVSYLDKCRIYTIILFSYYHYPSTSLIYGQKLKRINRFTGFKIEILGYYRPYEAENITKENR